MTCGWNGNSTSTSSGPERTAAASCSVCEIPCTRLMKTTGETGRNVPVPRRWTANAAPSSATFARWSSTTVSASSSISVGGIRVMWVGTSADEGSRPVR